jgi:GntR family phosphonate transport system transcriptional regulator
MALWQEISQALAQDIDDGVTGPGVRLPASAALAARFGVNRHTILRAISHLQEEGLVRTERGGGIYVESVIPYRMGPRTRLEENLLELNKVPGRELISIVEAMPAQRAVARALDIAPGDEVTFVTVVGVADGVPISYDRNYYPCGRLPGAAAAFRSAATNPDNSALATSAVLKAIGVADYRRKAVRIRTRPADASELRYLRLRPNEGVLEVEVTNVDARDVPIVYGSAAFSGSRVEFVLDL